MIPATPFTKCPIAIHELGLSYLARWVYCEIADRVNGGYSVSLRQIAERLHANRHSVVKTVETLVHWRLIEVEHKGHGARSQYTLAPPTGSAIDPVGPLQPVAQRGQSGCFIDPVENSQPVAQSTQGGRKKQPDPVAQSTHSQTQTITRPYQTPADADGSVGDTNLGEDISDVDEPTVLRREALWSAGIFGESVLRELAANPALTPELIRQVTAQVEATGGGGGAKVQVLRERAYEMKQAKKRAASRRAYEQQCEAERLAEEEEAKRKAANAGITMRHAQAIVANADEGAVDEAWERARAAIPALEAFDLSRDGMTAIVVLARELNATELDRRCEADTDWSPDIRLARDA